MAIDSRLKMLVLDYMCTMRKIIKNMLKEMTLNKLNIANNRASDSIVFNWNIPKLSIFNHYN
jgi:hypothetical protein